ncbi:MAG: class I mannose-6-phosphate isomerase [Bacteroidetes bacterium]|nr:class I mannose-6-phosphate isomerase [Bacteroidota bacterium]
MLYPFKFKTQFFEKIWGANNLKYLPGKNCAHIDKCGESWEISGLENKSSEIENGFLAGNFLDEIVEVYMEDLVGERVFSQYGNSFPLLVKFLDTADYLSVQVHPGNNKATLGKAEMWYVVNAEPESEIILGFNQKVNKEAFIYHLENKSLRSILNIIKPKAGDVFYIPPGTIHAIGAGVTLLEIQQSSDITYRVYDWDRPGLDGKQRELNIEQALNTIDFEAINLDKISFSEQLNQSVSILQTDYFTANVLAFNKPFKTDYVKIDSFVILCCVEGSYKINIDGVDELIEKGRCILLPADSNEIELISDFARIIEVFV